MMTKIPEVLKSGSGKRWVWITGVVGYIRSTLCNRMEYRV